MLILSYGAEEIMQGYVVNCQDLDERLDRDVSFSFFDSPVLDVRQIILLSKFFKRFKALLFPKFGKSCT